MAAMHASNSSRRWTAACFVIAIVITVQLGLVSRSQANPAPANQAPQGEGVPIAAILVPVTGTVTMVSENLVGVIETHASSAVGFNVDAATLVTRDGEAAPISALRPGDPVAMTVDARTGQIIHLQSEPAGFAWQRWLNIAGPLASLALGASLIVLIVRRWDLMPHPRLGLLRLPEPTAHALRQHVTSAAGASIDTPRATSHSCGTA